MAWVPGYEEKYNDYMSGRLTAGTGRAFARAMDNGVPDMIENADGYVYDNLPRLREPISVSVVSPSEPPAIAAARAAAAAARRR